MEYFIKQDGRESILFLSQCQAEGEQVSKALCSYQRAAQPKEQRRPTKLSALSQNVQRALYYHSSGAMFTCPLLALPQRTPREQSQSL